jgi:hypothetical protein
MDQAAPRSGAAYRSARGGPGPHEPRMIRVMHRTTSGADARRLIPPNHRPRVTVRGTRGSPSLTGPSRIVLHTLRVRCPSGAAGIALLGGVRLGVAGSQTGHDQTAQCDQHSSPGLPTLADHRRREATLPGSLGRPTRSSGLFARDGDPSPAGSNTMDSCSFSVGWCSPF